MKKKEKSKKGKFIFFTLIAVIGWMSYQAMQDSAPPTENVRKVIQHEAFE